MNESMNHESGRVEETRRVAVLGEALIDLIADGEGRYRPHLGGSPFNVAIGLARQGVEASYLSPFSDDVFGDRLCAALQREGVRTAIRRRSQRPTSLAVVTLDQDGVPGYRLYREGVADKDVSLEEILDALPGGMKIFHTGSLAITPSQLPKIQALFESLRAQGVLISVDINIRLGASADTGRYLRGVRSLFPLVDILKASDEDLLGLGLGGDPGDAAREARGWMNQGILVMTRGQGGALALGAQGAVERPAYPVDRVRDTVGAGDTFHATLLAALLHSEHLEPALAEMPEDALGEALEQACAAAAINVSRDGCDPPTRDEVAAYLGRTAAPARPEA